MKRLLLALSIIALAQRMDSIAQTETNRFVLPYLVRDAEFDPVRPRVFVLATDAGSGASVEVVDLETRASKRFTFDWFLRKMALSPDGKRLYINMAKTQNSSSVAIFDTAEFEFLREVEIAAHPHDMVVTDSGFIIFSTATETQASYIRVFESEQGNQVGMSGAVPPRLSLALNPELGIIYATEELPDRVHHHFALSPAGAITAHWEVSFQQAIFSNRLFPFPDGTRVLSASGHVLTSTPEVQTDLKPAGDTEVSFISSASFETNENRIALVAQHRVYFVDAGTLQQIESRKMPGVQFVGAYGERTAVITLAPDTDSRSEIRWLLPRPATASENLVPYALLVAADSRTIIPVDSTLAIQVHGRDADGEVASTRIFSGTNVVSESADAVVNANVRIRPGTNQIYAVVTDSFGAAGTSTVHQVYGNFDPKVYYSTVRTSYPQVQPVTILAEATDEDGEIKVVRLLRGNEVIAEDETAPYELLFTPSNAGNYSFELEAEDNLGATTRRALPTITFQGGSDDFRQDMFVQTIGFTNLFLSGSNAGATSQKGEPLHAGVQGGKSIWWAWRVPNVISATGGVVGIDTIGSDFDTLLAVYSGGPNGTNDIAKLKLLAANDDDLTHAPASHVKFFAVEGDLLYIAVDGREGVEGNVKLRINFAAAAGTQNDNFSGAGIITTAATGSNQGATKEPGELDHAGNAGGASVWWRMSVGADTGPIRISTAGSRFDTLLAVYTTNIPPRVIPATITNLILVAANDDGNFSTRTSELTFIPPKPGNYWIAVDGYDGAEGTITLSVMPLSSLTPQNNQFASASTLFGGSVLTNGHTIRATLEPGEPQHAGKTNSGSVWFKWTAPTNGLVSISTRTSDFDTILAVYKGTNLASLIPIASNDDDPANPPTSAVQFHASQGVEYFIAVAGYGQARGEFVLALNQRAGISPRIVTESTDGTIRLKALDSGAVSVLEASINLVDWEVARTLGASDTFEISPGGTIPQQFYRLRLIE